MKRNQSGFTLIEIAIVLVIIGLLLGGVMKGQELINSAKVKNLATDFRNVPVYVYGYQDKYHAIPGDDANAASHVTGATPATGGFTGNGVINGVWNAPLGAVEANAFWQQVRLAGLAPGPTTDPTSTDLHPTNAMGGRIGVTNSITIAGTAGAADNPITLPTPLTGSFIVCSDNIPGKFALQLDIALDDGNPLTGALRVTAAGTATGGTAVDMATLQANPDTPYLVCQGY